MLVWNYQRNVSYTIKLQISNSIPNLYHSTYIHPDENAVIRFGKSFCSMACQVSGFSRSCKEQRLHDKGETITHFYCAKYSITDGTLLSHHKESVRTAVPENASAFGPLVPVNREGLYFYSLVSSESQPPSSSPSSSPQALAKDDCPILLDMCFYDMKKDQLSIRQHRGIASRALLRSMLDFGYAYFPWKDMLHIEAQWSMIDVAMRTRLGDGPLEKFRIVKYENTYPNYNGFCYSVDDMNTVVFKHIEDCVVVNWYDELAYEQARLVGDPVEPESS